MGKENNISTERQTHIPDIPKRNQIARDVLDKLVAYTPFLRREIVNPERLVAARKILREGVGLCIVANHISQGETVLIYQIPFGDPELRRKRVVAPLAAHQKLFFFDSLSHALGLRVKYIVTKETVKRAQKKGKSIPTKKGQLEREIEFMKDAVETLSRGGIVILFPQATRRETLYSPNDPKTISTLMNRAKKSEVRLGFLFVGVDLADTVKDYSRVRGFNLFKKYKLTIGNTLTGEDLLAQAGGKLGKVDEIVYKELEGLVSPKYSNAISKRR